MYVISTISWIYRNHSINPWFLTRAPIRLKFCIYLIPNQRPVPAAVMTIQESNVGLIGEREGWWLSTRLEWGESITINMSLYLDVTECFSHAPSSPLRGIYWLHGNYSTHESLFSTCLQVSWCRLTTQPVPWEGFRCRLLSKVFLEVTGTEIYLALIRVLPSSRSLVFLLYTLNLLHSYILYVDLFLSV